MRETARVGTTQAEQGRRRREATRAALLAATRALLERGEALADRSVGTICKEAGVSRATFYLHYDDKRALIADLAAVELAEWSGILEPVVGDLTADRPAMRAAVGELTAMWLRHQAVLAGIVELAAYDEQAEAAWRAQLESIADVVEDYLRRRDPDDARDLRTLARALVWAAERVLHKLATRPGEDPEQVAEALTELAWSVIAPR